MVNQKQTDIIRRRYDRAARFFHILDSLMESSITQTWRQRIWSYARGDILEVGVGTGINMSFYPSEASITAVDFSQKMLAQAEARKQKLRIDTTLIWTDIQELPFADNSFDTIIGTCVFCSVPDPILGFQEVRRVCRPDGQLIFLEHVRSSRPLVGKLMDWLNPVSLRLIGANINRCTIINMETAGLKIVHDENLRADIFKLIIAEPDK